MDQSKEFHWPVPQSDPQVAINRAKDQDFLVCQCGRLIGHANGDTYFYVYDGKVWSSGLSNSCVEIGDYMEFCDTLRSGGVDGFKPVNHFHLKNGG